MKTLLICAATIIFFLIQDARAATLKCSNSKPGNTTDDYNINSHPKEGNQNSLKKIFHNIQCTLEKAKPWVAELQQEAKRLEEAAKLLGLGILNSFGEFVDKLVEETADKTTNTLNATLGSDESAANSTDITAEERSPYLCPEGFVADHNGICERID